MKIKIFFAIGGLALMGASCNLLGGSSATAGVLRTANGGVDWQFSNKVKDNDKASISGLSISRIQYSASATDRVYLGSYNGGMWRSEDGGGSWENVLSKISVYDFAVHPNDDNTVYAAGFFGDHGRVLVTRDAGKSWLEIFSEATTNNAVRSIAVNPDDPTQIVIGLSEGALIKSSDGGTSWKLLSSYNDRINRIAWQGGRLYAVVRNSGVFRSTDGGANFENMTASLMRATNLLGLTFSGSPVGVFNRLAVSKSNPDLLYLTTDQGLYRSKNGGGLWESVSLPVNRARQVSIMDVALAPSSDNIIYVGGGSIVYKSSDGGNSWLTQDTKSGGLVNALLIDPDLPQVAFAGIYIQ
jgi:photosystem II stability/assembly factor-like uncharacterized protein